MSKKFIILTTFLTLLAGFGILSAPTVYEESRPEQPVYQREHVLEIRAAELGIVVDSMNLYYDDANYYEKEKNLGYYEAPDTIILERGQPHQEELITLAHEYIHHVWYHMSDEEKDAVEPGLMEFYNNDREFYERMQPYREADLSSYELVNEMFAVLCSEYKTEEIGQEFADYCKEFIPNRDTIFTTEARDLILQRR